MFHFCLTLAVLFMAFGFCSRGLLGGNKRDVDRERAQKRNEKNKDAKAKKADGKNQAQALSNKKER